MCHDILVISLEREKFKTEQMTSRQKIEVATRNGWLDELTRSLSEKLMLRKKYKLKTPVEVATRISCHDIKMSRTVKTCCDYV